MKKHENENYYALVNSNLVEWKNIDFFSSKSFIFLLTLYSVRITEWYVYGYRIDASVFFIGSIALQKQLILFWFGSSLLKRKRY